MDEAASTVPAESTATAAVVVTCGGTDRLRNHLATWHQQTLPFASLIVVDNGSPQSTTRWLEAAPGVRLVRLAENRGFAAGANAGIREALATVGTDFVALINDDVALDADWHRQAFRALHERPDCGSCATCLLQADRPDRIDTAGIVWITPWFADNARHDTPAPPPDARPEEIAGACAGAALFRRAYVEDVGLFDESLFAYQEDVDLALRGARRGWRTIWAPAARGFHQAHASNRRFPLGGTWADFRNARNRLTVLVKSLPADVWRRYGGRILLSFAADAGRSFRERRAGAVLAGQLCGAARLPRVLWTRFHVRPADRSKEQS